MLHQVTPPVADSSLLMCLPPPPAVAPFGSLRVQIVVAQGASWYDVAVADQYFFERGATVTVLCHGADPTITLLDDYYPRYSLLGCTDLESATLDGDVVFIAGGFASTSELRISSFSSKTLSQFLFLLDHRVAVVVGSSAELLIESLAIPKINASLIPYTTGAVAMAASHFGRGEPNASLNASIVDMGQNHIVVAAQSSALVEALVKLARHLGFNGDVVPSSCATNTLLPRGGRFELIRQAEFEWLRTRGNTHSGVVTINGSALEVACRNVAGDDFCTNRRIGVVVADGSHDTEVISILDALRQLPALSVVVVCTDMTRNGVAYLMPHPARTVTYEVACNATLTNSSTLALIIPGGIVATHQNLVDDVGDLMHALPSVTLYGTATALMTQFDVSKVFSRASECPYSGPDLEMAGYTRSGPNTPVHQRDSTIPRTVVTCGFAGDNTTANLASFLPVALQSMVWESDTKDRSDLMVGAFAVGLPVFVVLVLLVSFRLRSANEGLSPYQDTVRMASPVMRVDSDRDQLVINSDSPQKPPSRARW